MLSHAPTAIASSVQTTDYRRVTVVLAFRRLATTQGRKLLILSVDSTLRRKYGCQCMNVPVKDAL